MAYLTKFIEAFVDSRFNLLGVTNMKVRIIIIIEEEGELEFLSSIKRLVLTYGTRVYMCS